MKHRGDETPEEGRASTLVPIGVRFQPQGGGDGPTPCMLPAVP
ncbi:hypothetical protein [Acetobacter sp.]